MKKTLVAVLAVAFVSSAAAQPIPPQAKERAAELVGQMTLDEKIDYIGGYNEFYIRAVPRLGIPEIRMADGPQGVRNNTRSTMFPCGVAAAATWDRALVRDMGRGLGQDARARGVHIMLGPGVNIYRSPLCGRNFEYFGEDPYLASETAVQYIEGMQSEGVMATIKHFAGNNQEWDRHQVSSDIDERTLHEIYLPAFRKAVEQAGVGAVMSSYNLVNGQHATENEQLAVDILRGMWGFEGIFMSDWNATYSAEGAANRGLDLEMPSARFMNARNLRPLIESGVVSERTIDLKCQHILQTLIAFGFLDRQQLDPAIPECNPFSDAAALDVARGGVVLLKNDGAFLPLTKQRDIVVLGPNSGNIPTGGGSGFVHPFSTVSVGEGMQMMGKKYRVTVLGNLPSASDMAAQGMVYTSADCKTPGLRGEYFANKRFEGTPALTRVDTRIGFNWKDKAPAEGLPADGFSIRWTGVFVPESDCTASLVMRGDDGYRLFVDGEEVLADWGNHSATTRKGSVEMKAGRKYALRLEYFDNASSAEVSFGYMTADPRAEDARIVRADAVIYCAGFDSSNEKENSDRTFALPEGQSEEIARLAALNENLIVVVNSGGGVDFSTFGDKAKAILMAWYPGQQGGQAIAEIVTGRISPSGRLPISVERRAEDNPTLGSYYENVARTHRKNTLQKRVTYNEGVFVGYRGYERSGVKPLYPFGYGLSYSTFEYSDLKVEKCDGGVVVSFAVRNTGGMDAAEVAQVYVGDVEASVPRPAKELKGYEKIFLKKGEQKRVEVTLTDEAFRFYDIFSHGFVTEPGDFNIFVGSSCEDIRLRGGVTL